MGAVTGSVVCGVQGRLPKKEAQVTRREGQGREWGAEFQAEKVAGTEQTGRGVVWERSLSAAVRSLPHICRTRVWTSVTLLGSVVSLNSGLLACAVLASSGTCSRIPHCVVEFCLFIGAPWPVICCILLVLHCSSSLNLGGDFLTPDMFSPLLAVIRPSGVESEGPWPWGHFSWLLVVGREQLVDGGFPLAFSCLCSWVVLSSFESDEVKRNGRQGGHGQFGSHRDPCCP